MPKWRTISIGVITSLIFGMTASAAPQSIVSAQDFLGAQWMESQLHRVDPTARNNGLINSYTIQTCLLYTSPSPRDATLSRMPSSA